MRPSTGDSKMKKFAILIAAIGLFASACTSDASAVSSNAGTDFAVTVGEAPEFDGCASTPVDEIENFEWVIVEGPNPDDVGKALRAEQATCSFILENTMVIEDVGQWTIELTVTDGSEQDADQVVVDVVE